MTWHLPTSHTTSPHVMSPPAWLLHIRLQSTTWHDILHHSTLHHHQRHTTETQPATTKTPPPDGTAAGCCAKKTRFGHCVGWSIALRTFYTQSLSLVCHFFPPWKFRPRLGQLYLYWWATPNFFGWTLGISLCNHENHTTHMSVKFLVQIALS